MNTRSDSAGTVSGLQEMPRDVQPERDLWAGVESHIAGRRRIWRLPVSLAASVALMTAGVWIGWHLQGDARRAVGPDKQAVIPASFRTDPEYLHQRDALLRALPEKLAQLPPESRQHVQESLRSIQQAIESIEVEMGRDASNVLLQELLINATQEEMRVLTALDMADGVSGRT